MLFNSPIFLFLFVPIFYALYYILPAKYKNLFILIGSIVFYAWGEPTFIYVALVSSFLDWVLSKFICSAKNDMLKRTYLGTSIVLNVALLFYFKYFNFFVVNINKFLETMHFQPLGVFEIALPLAVSFIVFEKITYVMDVFRGKGKPSSSLLDYFTYILIFPKLIAGPIIKYHDIEQQIQSRVITKEDVMEGFFRFVKGLFKKVIIADTMATAADAIFALAPAQLGFFDAWLGVICFTIQIYFDFSGYSDMAIGLLRAMGFRIMENFNLPYISRNFTDFWRRWHISLSTFIKDYLYIPLGGNRCSKPRQYFNLMVCFLISGIWHGANWTFVLWGVFHGVFLTIDKALGLKPDTKRFMPVPLQVFVTFILVMLSWTIFRSQTIHQFITFSKTMVSPQLAMFNSSWVFTNDVICWLIIGIIISFIPATNLYAKIRDNVDKRFYLKFCSFFVLLILIIGKISAITNVTFIYFRF